METITTLPAMLHQTIEKYPRQKAVISKVTVNYREFGEQVNRLAHALMNLDVIKGSRVGLLLSNSLEFMYAYFGILSIGAVVVPLNTFLKQAEIQYILQDCKLDVLIIHDHFRPITAALPQGLVPHIIVVSSQKREGSLLWQNIVRQEPVTRTHRKIDPDDMAVILYTSGTTGHPKGVVLTHRNLLANVTSSCQTIQITAKDRFLLILPLFHAFTCTVCMLIPFFVGGSIILLSKIERQQLKKALIRKRPTILVGIPQLYNMLAQYPYFRALRWLNPIRLCISGAAPLSMETLEKFEQKFKIPLLEGYGLSEASPVVSINPPDKKRKPSSVGLPLPGIEVKVLDAEENELPPNTPGELAVKGENVMQGYFHLPEETKKVIRGEWLLTGDMARIDEEGFIFLVDRKKDMLLVKGLNVYPREIEELLNSHPKIQDSAVIGLSGGLKGEIPKAFIVLKEKESLTEQEVKAFCKKNLASYKIPRYIEFRTSLPKTPTGKILKKNLRQEEEQKTHDQRD